MLVSAPDLTAVIKLSDIVCGMRHEILRGRPLLEAPLSPGCIPKVKKRLRSFLSIPTVQKGAY